MGCAQDGWLVLCALNATLTKDPGAVGSFPRRRHSRLPARRRDWPRAPVALSKRPDRPVGRWRLRKPCSTAALPNDTCRPRAGIDDRVDPGRVQRPILSRRLMSTSAQVLRRLRVAVLTGRHDSADQVVGESHDPPRRPEGIVGAHLDLGGGRCARLPGLGSKFALEPPDSRVFRSRRSARG